VLSFISVKNQIIHPKVRTKRKNAPDKPSGAKYTFRGTTLICAQGASLAAVTGGRPVRFTDGSEGARDGSFAGRLSAKAFLSSDGAPSLLFLIAVFTLITINYSPDPPSCQSDSQKYRLHAKFTLKPEDTRKGSAGYFLALAANYRSLGKSVRYAAAG